MYASQADMEQRFPVSELVSLTAKNGGDGVDAAVLAAALASAVARIDAYLSTRYSLPLSDVPEILRGLCCDIARYELDPRPPEDVQRRFHAAIAFLRDVQAGKAALQLDGGSKVASTASVQYVSAGRTFTRNSLRDF